MKTGDPIYLADINPATDKIYCIDLDDYCGDEGIPFIVHVEYWDLIRKLDEIIAECADNDEDEPKAENREQALVLAQDTDGDSNKTWIVVRDGIPHMFFPSESMTYLESDYLKGK